MATLSVCIPAYKRMDYLKILLEKVPEDIPVYISDNGGHISPNFQVKSGNIRISPSERELTMFENWNRAASLTDSEWFVLPGDDDIILKDSFDKYLKAIEKYPDAGLIIFGHDIIDREGMPTTSWRPAAEEYIAAPDGFAKFRYGVPCRWPSIIFNKKKFDNVGGFDTDFRNTASDSLLIQRMMLKYAVAFIPEITGQYRAWDGAGTSVQIMTTEWFSLISLWMDKLEAAISEEGYSSRFDVAEIRRKTILSNVLFALKCMRDKGWSIKQKAGFLRQIEMPKGLGIKDRLRLAKAFLR